MNGAVASASFNPPLRAWSMSYNRRVMVIGYSLIWDEASTPNVQFLCYYNDIGVDLGRIVRIPEWDIKFMQGFWPAIPVTPFEEMGEDPQAPENGEIQITGDPTPS